MDTDATGTPHLGGDEPGDAASHDDAVQQAVVAAPRGDGGGSVDTGPIGNRCRHRKCNEVATASQSAELMQSMLPEVCTAEVRPWECAALWLVACLGTDPAATSKALHDVVTETVNVPDSKSTRYVPQSLVRGLVDVNTSTLINLCAILLGPGAAVGTLISDVRQAEPLPLSACSSTSRASSAPVLASLSPLAWPICLRSWGEQPWSRSW